MSTNLRFLSTEATARLVAAVEPNLAAYRGGQTASLVKEGELLTSKITAGDPPPLLEADAKCKSDADAAEAVHRWLVHLTPVQAADARLWTWLAHGPFAEYVHTRWGSALKESEQPVDRVLERWFFRGRGVATFVRSAVARLWWFGHLTHDRGRANPYELTPVLVTNQDMQQAFLERSFGRSRVFIRTVLDTALKHDAKIATAGNRGDIYKAWAKALNAFGGAFVLEAVPPERLVFIVESKLRDLLET